jgi:hypothetical protein
MKLDVTYRKGLALGLVLVTSVSLFYLADSTAREKGRTNGAANQGATEASVDTTSPVFPARGRSPESRPAQAKRLDLLAIRSDSQGPVIRGERLSPVRSPINPHEDRGRVAALRLEGVEQWRKIAAGDAIRLPSLDGEGLEAVVALAVQEQGWLRIGGELRDTRGTFALHTNFREVRGQVLFPESEMAYEIQTDPSGEVILMEKPLEALLCTRYRPPAVALQQFPGELASGPTVAQGAAIPEINTRPGAKGVVFLDFDGAQVTDPAWNGGKQIVALPSSMTPDQIRAVVDAVAEDYAPFDLTITTSQSVYNAAPVGRRMWVIVTPTSTAAPGSGGVAYVNSWSSAGRSFSSTVPCWVFNGGVKAATDTISHEVGHTLGLNHDGSSREGAYYSGHGGGLSVPTSWGPIMGAPFDKSVTQWSKGEYSGSTNTQDDVYLIARDQNGFGYRADSSGATALVNAVLALPIVGGSFDVSGIIRKADIVEMHQFSTSGGTLSATVRPTADRATNADLRLEVRDATGATLAFSSPVETLGASVSRSLPSGTYWLVVAAAGTGDRPVGGYTSGYSSYGSLGGYKLTGMLSNSVETPLLPRSGKVSATVGAAFEYILPLTAGVRVSETPAPLPPGIRFDATRVAFVGVPTEVGVWECRVRVANASAQAEGVLQITVDAPFLTLADGIDENRGLRTTTTAPWSPVWMNRSDGLPGPVAASGMVADGSSSSVGFITRGPSLMTFWWKTSSEASKDVLECLVNGKRAVHSVDGTGLVISGETDWIPVQVDVPAGARNFVEFRYSKDSVGRAGSDRGWVYGVQIRTQPPKFRSNLRSVSVVVKAGTMRIIGDVQGAIRYEWKLNGVTIFDQSGSSRTIEGSKTPELRISGVSAADIGVYQLEATNASGTTVSRPVFVELAAPPVFTQPLVPPLGLRVGETLRLAAQVSGSGPMEYAWYKDGRLLARTKSPVLELSTTGGKAGGNYKLAVSNRFGSVVSGEVAVRFR